MKDVPIVSVSAYLDRLNVSLKSEKSKIVGELCNLQMYEGRSYLYFSIKDSKDGSTVKCFMWKNDYKISGVELRDGLEIIVTAYPSIYKPNGGLSLQVELVELVGEGALQLAYEQLKKKLETEGLLSDMRKRTLPEYPHRIGVITSKSGAVINDFLTNIGKFGFEILFVDSKVEGQDAIKDLLNAVETFKKKEIDVLVIMRGGGSLESFLAFNNETLVRAVASFPVPVLTGIGHDKDVSLVALVSDKNVSTPTAVANILNQSWSMALGTVQLSEQKIVSEFESRLKDVEYRVAQSQVLIERKFVSVIEFFSKAENKLSESLSRIELEIARYKQTVVYGSKEIFRGMESLLKNFSDSLEMTAKTIELSSPERQLRHGYSIVRSSAKIVRSVQDVKNGEALDIMVSDGIIHTRVS